MAGQLAGQQAHEVRLEGRPPRAARLLGEGLDTQQIAARLHLSPKTVETYRARVRTKLGVESGSDVFRLAVCWVLENA